MINLNKLFTKVKNCSNNPITDVNYSKKNIYFLKFLKSQGFISSFKKIGKNGLRVTFKLDIFGNSSLSFFRVLYGNKKLRPLSSLNRDYFYSNFNSFFSRSQLKTFKGKKTPKRKDLDNVLLILK